VSLMPMNRSFNFFLVPSTYGESIRCTVDQSKSAGCISIQLSASDSDAVATTLPESKKVARVVSTPGVSSGVMFSTIVAFLIANVMSETLSPSCKCSKTHQQEFLTLPAACHLQPSLQLQTFFASQQPDLGMCGLNITRGTAQCLQYLLQYYPQSNISVYMPWLCS